MRSANPILLPLTYLGPVSYFASVMHADEIHFDLYENYIKQTYRNRCRIFSANGVLDLVIPVKKVNGNHTLVKDIAIEHTQKWQQNHWRAIESAYSKAPYFLYYKTEFEEFYNRDHSLLSEFNRSLLERTLSLLGVKRRLIYTDKYLQKDTLGITDLRNVFNQKEKARGNFPQYFQVFSDKFGFRPDLSIIDLLFNLGPDAKVYLKDLN